MNNNTIRNIIGRPNITSSIKVEEGDYEVDGLLYCGKCHTPKQVEFNLGNEIIKPLCICKCREAEIEAEEREEEKKKYRQRIERMRKEGFPQSEMSKWTFAVDDHANDKLSRIAMNYVEHFEKMKERGKGLLFFGSVGTGKTFLSACIVNALIDKGYPCLMTNFSRLVNTISGMYAGKQDYIDGLNKFDLLVLDDLASERDTEYMNELVHTIIDSRYRAGLPTIITTNLSGEELYSPKEIHRQRTYSRVLEMTVPVKVEGVDRRKEKLKEDMKDLNELLGL